LSFDEKNGSSKIMVSQENGSLRLEKMAPTGADKPFL